MESNSEPSVVTLDKLPPCLPSSVPTPYSAHFSQDTIDNVLSMRNGGINFQKQTNGVEGRMDAKIVLLGDAAVGKTSLFYRIFRNEFTDIYKTTIGVDFCLLDYLILSVPFRLQLWDTAGSERFKSLTYGYYRGAQVVILTFDVTNLQAVDSLQKWHTEVSTMMEMHNNSASPMFFVVGTKVDLLPGVQDCISASASIKVQEVEKRVKDFCTVIGAELWFTSSKLNVNVDAFFNRVAGLLFDNLICKQLNASLNRSTRVENVDCEESDSRPGSGRIRLKPDTNLRGTLTRQTSGSRSCCGYPV